VLYNTASAHRRKESRGNGHLSEVQDTDPQERQPREARQHVVPQVLPGHARQVRQAALAAHRALAHGDCMHVGFVGTGNMGHPMAANVLKAGHRLTVWDVRTEATRELEGLGATRAKDLPSLAAGVRVTLLSLPDDAIVEKVLVGDGGPGLLDGARRGDVVFDLSTVSP